MTKFKRLYFDIETSPNIVYSWNTGYNLTIDPESIIQERAIICICYKWEGDKKVHSLEWNKGSDKELLKNFIKIMNEADEIIGHNSDKYDIKWVKTRCLFHRIQTIPFYKSVDTLKISRSQFRFNSNKLDYISKFLGFGGKIKTSYSLWKRIMDGDKKALEEMIKYCKKDVIILEEVYKTINSYAPQKTHMGVFQGGKKCDCPKCGSEDTIRRGEIVSAVGQVKVRMSCKKCNVWFQVPASTYRNENLIKNNKAKV